MSAPVSPPGTVAARVRRAAQALLRAPSRLPRPGELSREVFREMPGRVGGHLRDPVTQQDLLQAAKAAAAAVIAWLVAVRLLHLPQPFLAPWAALLTVHATVYRSVSRGAQQVVATVLGVLLSFVVATLLGPGAVALGAAMLAALLLARVGVLRDEGVTVATTALFVLTTGYEHQEQLLGARVLDTLVGIAVGVAINLVVLPPVNDRSAAHHVDVIDQRLGDLLTRIAGALGDGCDDEDTEAWIEETRAIDRELDHAWEVVSHARESLRLNPRGRRRLRDRSIEGDACEELSYEQVLVRLEDGVSEARSMARTIRESTVAADEWDPRFREPWLALLSSVGEGVRSPREPVEPLVERIDELSRALSVHELPGLRWPVYGALITNLQNLAAVVDDVASALPVRT